MDAAVVGLGLHEIGHRRRLGILAEDVVIIGCSRRPQRAQGAALHAVSKNSFPHEPGRVGCLLTELTLFHQHPEDIGE